MKKLIAIGGCLALLILNARAQGRFEGFNETGRLFNQFTAELVGPGIATGQYWIGLDAGSLAPVGPVTPVLMDGIVDAGVITTGLPAGRAVVLLAAWFNVTPSVIRTTDAVFIDLVLGNTPPNRPAFRRDIVLVVPETSTIALAVFGAAALFLGRRLPRVSEGSVR